MQAFQVGDKEVVCDWRWCSRRGAKEVIEDF